MRSATLFPLCVQQTVKKKEQGIISTIYANALFYLIKRDFLELIFFCFLGGGGGEEHKFYKKIK